jgi:hypothetical protein
MGLLQAYSLVPLTVIFLCCAVSASTIYVFYGRSTRRTVHHLRDTYDIAYEQVTAQARDLHISLATALSKSKETVDQLRFSSMSTDQQRAALCQIIGWLQEASEKSDHALRSLEK